MTVAILSKTIATIYSSHARVLLIMSKFTHSSVGTTSSVKWLIRHLTPKSPNHSVVSSIPTCCDFKQVTFKLAIPIAPCIVSSCKEVVANLKHPFHRGMANCAYDLNHTLSKYPKLIILGKQCLCLWVGALC